MSYEVVKKEVKESLLLSIMLLVLSVILFWKNIDVLENLVSYIGIAIIAFGIFQGALFLKSRDVEKKISVDLFRFLSFTSIGIVLLSKNELFNDLLPVLIGCYFLIRNSNRIQIFINLKFSNYEIKTWYYVLIGINMLLSFYFIFNPINFHLTETKLMAIFMIVIEGIYLFTSLVLLHMIRKAPESNVLDVKEVEDHEISS